ncbi:unnamed protein product [Auanema sp. JU1783]|nr:unnamed protein product [Auanema sp. JU1783]
MLRVRALGYETLRRNSTAPIIKKINRVLIANRGEIAIRVMKTSQRMGIETVAVFSDADRNALFVKKADRAYNIGPAQSSQSYLNIDRVIDTAIKSGAQAIHPGYGFLSENSAFAEACRANDLVFIGPPVQAIKDMGTKSLAKQIMQDAKVPVVEGFHGSDQSDANLKIHSAKIGYPVMLKAVYGGGGKGMRIAWNEAEFDEKLASARNEAMKSFGNDEMLVEKFVERPRHIEVQVFGDHHGNYVHLWERDCSVQRRHQKIIEEAPAPLINMETRQRLGESAKRAAAAVRYVGAGTVEFIMDPRGDFYFMEMNTRLQVEHPVTEAITGTDLVEWQLRVAQGEPLPLKQEEIPLNGHAFECRVYAEDTSNGAFMPTAGKINHISFPENARIDTGVVSGDEVSVHYDPMIAKVIVWGQNREVAAAKLDDALKKSLISGLPTNIDFVRTVLNHQEFKKGNVYTDFIPDFHTELFTPVNVKTEVVIERALGKVLLDRLRSADSLYERLSEFRVNHSFEESIPFESSKVNVISKGNNNFVVSDNGASYACSVSNINNKENTISFTIEWEGKRWNVFALQLQNSAMIIGEEQSEFTTAEKDFMAALEGEQGGNTSAVAPMPGIIEKVLVKEGDTVKQGESLVVMTAMKMEYIIKAPKDCTIEAISCLPGKSVAKNSVLVKFQSS